APWWMNKASSTLRSTTTEPEPGPGPIVGWITLHRSTKRTTKPGGASSIRRLFPAFGDFPLRCIGDGVQRIQRRDVTGLQVAQGDLGDFVHVLAGRAVQVAQ